MCVVADKNCSAGTFGHLGTGNCEDCGYGFYQNETGKLSCQRCPDDTEAKHGQTNATGIAQCSTSKEYSFLIDLLKASVLAAY